MTYGIALIGQSRMYYVSMSIGVIYNRTMLDRLRRLLNPPIFQDEEKTRASRFLVIFSWVAIVAILFALIFRLWNWRQTYNTPALVLAAFIAILGIMQIIIRLGYVKAASFLVLIIMWGVITILANYAHGVRDAAVIGYFVVLLLSSILLERHYLLLFSLMSISSIWYFAILEKQGIRSLLADDPVNYAWDLTGIFVLVSMLAYLLITNWTFTFQSARVELKERMQAEEKLQKQADYLTALHETALGLLNQSELVPLLKSILTRACHLIETQHGEIGLVTPDGSAIRQQVGQGVLAKYEGSLIYKGEGVTGRVWAKGQSFVIQDYTKWDQALPEYVDGGFKAVLGVPLKLEDSVIGVLAVSYLEEDRAFTNEQINLMERFAALAALAIHNTRLNEQVQNELQERKAAQLEMHASEEKFRRVFDASPVAICIISLEEGRLLEANDAFWRISGFDPATSIGCTAEDLNMVESMEKRRELVERLKREHSIHDPDDNFITPQNEQRSTHTFYELIEIKGQPCMLTMLYDVTEQRQAQNSLKDAEARTHALLTAIPDMIFEVSKDGVITGYIPSTEIIPVMSPEQFLGKNIKEVFPPDISHQTLFAVERALETNQLHAFEYSMPPGRESQFFEARVSAISADAAMIMVREISQRKWIETEREKLIGELEEKNAELERFAYTVSHDLKSPLITIKGFLGFVEQDAAKGDTARLKVDLKRIADAADKMQSLLNELLELSRVGRLMNPYEHVSFDEIAREAVELVQGRLSTAHARIHIQENLPSVYGDRRRLVEVLQNLLDNAAKFFGDQSQPEIEVGLKGVEDNKPVFFVRDNGIGIKPEHQDRIFGLFTKLDTDSEGTGIGLSLVKRIVEVHHGRIWVESEQGKGSTFFFTLQTEPEA